MCGAPNWSRGSQPEARRDLTATGVYIEGSSGCMQRCYFKNALGVKWLVVSLWSCHLNSSCRNSVEIVELFLFMNTMFISSH